MGVIEKKEKKKKTICKKTRKKRNEKKMANNMRSRRAAQKALDTYRAIPGFKVDEETALSDLIADLMHLADSKDVSGEYIADRARGDYLEEKNDE